LIDEYADRMIGMVRHAWADHQTFQHVTGTSICLSCLLERGRYDELQELLATRRMKFWSWHRFGAEALVRQGLWEPFDAERGPWWWYGFMATRRGGGSHGP
jgi:hypothetical protein